MRKLLTLFLSLGLLQLQANSIDSLYQVIKFEKDLTNLPSLVIQYEKLAIEKSEWVSLTDCYFLLGYKYSQADQIQLAYRYYLETIRFAEKLDDISTIIKTQINLGTVHLQSFAFGNALNYYQQALINAIELDNVNYMAISHLHIGLAYKKIKKHDYAMKSYFNALRLFKKSGSIKQAAEMYIEIGSCYKEEEMYIEASEYYHKAMNENPNSDDIRARVLNNDALVKWQLGDTLQAIKKAKESLVLKRKMGNQKRMVSSLNNLGIFYYELNEFDKAIPLLIEAFNINNEKEYSGKMAEELHETISYLERIEKKIGNSTLIDGLNLYDKSRKLNLKLLERMIILEPMGKQAELKWIGEQHERKALEEKYELYYLIGIVLAIGVMSAILVFFKRREIKNRTQQRALLNAARQKINRIFT